MEGVIISSVLVNWIVGGILLYFDLTQPNFLTKYKIQSPNENLGGNTVIKVSSDAYYEFWQETSNTPVTSFCTRTLR